MNIHQTRFAARVAAAAPPVELTPEQLATIASQIDISTKVDKILNYSLVANTEIAKIHESGSDNQVIPDALADLSEDATHRIVTDTEKTTWTGKEPGNANIQTHVTSAHAPATSQANADITKEEIEAKLTGAITSHTHAGGGGMNMLKTTADQTINAGAGVFADITGLTFPVVAGIDYAFHFYITFRSAATTTGWKAGVNCPAGVLDFWAQSDVIANGAAGVATHTERHNVTRDDMTLLTGTVTQGVDLAVRIEGRYKCTQNGTFAPRFANELAANTQLAVQKGSWGWWF